MKMVVLVLAGLLAVASFTPLIRQDDWWIRVFDFPRMQIFVLGVLALVAFFFFWDVRTRAGGAVLAVLAVGIALQAYRIFPYTPFSPKQVMTTTQINPDATVALLVANVLMDNREAGQLIDIIRSHNPDIILTLEPDVWWEQQLRVLEEDYPYTLKVPLDNRYGMLLHSRLALVDPEIKYLVSDEFPSMHMQVRLLSGDLVRLHCLHPEPPSPTEAAESTRRDAELLIVGREVKGRDEPTIVAGDLNDVAWSYTTTLFQKISGLLDPRKGRGMFNTFHAEYPMMRWPLDHVFHSDNFMLADMQRLPAFGSDHFPVYARLVLQPGAEAVQDEPEANQEDQEQAQEKIDKVDQQEDL
jgi:endonuclease/exonuclease/phosphatase (EEP) superfamily protein YafD